MSSSLHTTSSSLLLKPVLLIAKMTPHTLCLSLSLASSSLLLKPVLLIAKMTHSADVAHDTSLTSIVTETERQRQRDRETEIDRETERKN